MKRLCLLLVSIAVFSLPSFGQQGPPANREIPEELQARDPEIRNLLQSVRSDYDAGDYQAAFSKAKTALALAEKKNLVGDKALAEEAVAIGYFYSGDLNHSIKQYRASLQDAVDSSNLVLQADVLVALSTSPQFQGNMPGALELLNRALAQANQSKNLFIKARVLGELGKDQVFSGSIEAGRHSITEALEIDKANGYTYEALHTVYLAYAILAATPPRADPTAGIAKLEEARDLAMQKGSYIALVLAESSLGQILIRKGEFSNGVQTLEAVRDGKAFKNGKAVEMPAGFHATVAQPFMKATLLESLAQGYEMAQEPDKALQAWTELYFYSVASGMNVTQGEAALRIATIYKNKNDAPDALKYFSIASETLRELQNLPQLSQSLIGRALLLIHLGKSNEAIPLEHEVAEIGRSTHNRQLQFIADVVLAEIYQPEGKLQETRGVLEQAAALISPGPMDSAIDNKLVIEDYARLADIYQKQNDPIRQMIALEKGFAVASFLKDQNASNAFALNLKQEIDSLRLESRIADSYKSGKAEDALVCSQILFIYKGPPKSSENRLDWNLVLNLPFRIATQPGGPSVLKADLDNMGPLLGIARLPILDALSEHYLYVENKPELARGYALQAVSVLGSSWPTDTIKVRSICTLAVAYSHTREFDLAHDALKKCLEYSNEVSDPASKVSAHAADALVHLSLGEFQSARDSLIYLRDSAPEDAAIHEQLAATFLSDGERQKALSEYELALHIYEKAGRHGAIANTYRLMGIALESGSSQQDRNAAICDLERAFDAYKEAGDEAGQALAQIALGEYYGKLNDARKAEDHLQIAVELARESQHKGVEAIALSDLGDSCFTQRRFSEAAEYHRKAAETYDKTGDSDSEVIALLQLGLDYEQQFKRADSLAAYVKAKSLASESNSDWVKSSVQLRLGWFYFFLGRYEEAETAFREAVRIAESAGDELNLARACLSLAEVLGTIGDWEEAVDAVSRALALSQKNKNPALEYQADVEMVVAYSDRTSPIKDFDKALSYYSDATKLSNDPKSSLWPFWVDQTAVLQLDLVEIYLQRREYDRAVSSAKQGIKACKRNKDDICLANGLISLGEAERRTGDLSSAESALRHAQPLVDREGDFYLKGRLLYGRAGLERAKGHLRDAVVLYEQVIDMVEKVKATTSLEAQKGVSENYDFIYDELIDTLFLLSRQTTGVSRKRASEEALRYCESNKARQFQQQWGRTFVARLRATLPASLQDQESALLEERDRLLAELQNSISDSKSVSNRSPAVVQKDLNTGEDKLKEFVASLRSSEPNYAALAYPDAVSIDSLPLHADELAIEFKVTDDATFVWMIEGTRGGSARLTSFYKVPEGRQWIAQRVNNIRTAFNKFMPESYAPRDSEELFEALFPSKYAGRLRGRASITVIPDDALFLIPFEILSPNATRGNFQLIATPTRYYPSLGALRVARGAPRRAHWQKAFLGIGDPITSLDDSRYTLAAAISRPHASVSASGIDSVSSGSDLITAIKSRGFLFNRLPGTAEEVKDVAGLFEAAGQPVEVFLGSQATKAHVESTDLAQFRFLHFATHGVLPSEGGIREPSLILSFDGSTPQSMLFRVTDILTLNIRADTVVLSACNTGFGPVSRAEGVMSLGRAFMTAGASSVTVSLWQVNDASTALLMEEYYRNLLAGKPKDQALANARFWLFKKGYRNPFDWAPFILIGE
jgi:tetratricopeptide (TPR) repeat protein